MINEVLRTKNTRKRKKLNYNYKPEFKKVYLPQNLIVEEIILEHPLPEKLLRAKDPTEIIARCKMILGSIAEAISYNKDSITNGETFVPLSSAILQKKGFRDYDKYLQWAIDAKIFECDGFYIPNEKCYGFRFTNIYHTKFVPHHLTNKSCLDKPLESVCKKTKAKFPELFEDLKNINIDLNEVKLELNKIEGKTKQEILNKNEKKWEKEGKTKEEINKLVEHSTSLKQVSRYNAAEKIANKIWYFKQDDNVGRLHTNLTGLKKELRKCLTYKGEKLVGIDLKNSQPFLASILFTDNWKNLNLLQRILKYNTELRYNKYHINKSKTKPNNITIMLGDLCNGKSSQAIETFNQMAQTGWLYEYMIDLYEQFYNKQTTRDKMKKKFLTLIFTPTHINNNNKFYLFIKEQLTEVIELFEWINTGYEKFKNGFGSKDLPKEKRKLKRKPNEQSSALASLLQSLESELILDKIVPILLEKLPNAPIWTIHDSIVTTVENENKVYFWIMMETFKMFGVSPSLEIEYKKWGVEPS